MTTSVLSVFSDRKLAVIPFFTGMFIIQLFHNCCVVSWIGIANYHLHSSESLYNVCHAMEACTENIVINCIKCRTEISEDQYRHPSTV